MTTAIHEDTEQRAADDAAQRGEGDPEQRAGRRLLAAHFEGLDLEALGLRYHADGGGFDVTTGPSDAKGLSGLLARATAVLRRLGSAARSEVAAAGDELRTLEQRAEERLHRWLVRKVRHLVRYALGRLAYLAAGQLGKRAQQKTAGKEAARRSSSGRRRADDQRSSRAPGSGTAEGGGRPGPAARPGARSGPAATSKGRPGRGGASGARSGAAAKGRGGPHPDGSVPPRAARKIARALPEDQVRHLAHGLTPDEVDRVAAHLPVKRAEDAAPALHEVEHAAQELIRSNG